MAEHLSDLSQRHPKFGKYYLSGKIRLLDLTAPSQPLRRLLESQDHDAREFRKHIRKYNTALTFTSLGATFDSSLFHRGSSYALRLMGELHHRLGALLLSENTTPSYAQLYIHNPAEARDFRMAKNPGLDATTMSDLQDIMLEHNPCIHQFKQA